MPFKKLPEHLLSDLAAYKEKYGDQLDKVARAMENSRAEMLDVLTTHCFMGLASMDHDVAEGLRFAAGRVLDAAAKPAEQKDTTP